MHFCQLILRSKILHFSEGSIIADSHEEASGLLVITSGFVNVELPLDSEEADEENRTENGKTLLFVFGRGCVEASRICFTCSYDVLCRDSVGGNAIVGDSRWTGSFGVNLDLVARSHCSVGIISTKDILVRL